MAYTPKTPSINTTITNSAEPAGWDFLGIEPQENVPRKAQAIFSGILYAVGIIVAQYALQYFTMDAIGASDITKELVDGTLTFNYCGDAMDNAYLVGGSLQFADTGNGIIACTYAQNIVTLGQRSDYVV